MFGLDQLHITEAQVAEFGVTFGLGRLHRLHAVHRLRAWRGKSNGGRFGTFVLFFVLAFGMLGFVAKAIIQKILGL